jgi:hypothetical protein
MGIWFTYRSSIIKFLFDSTPRAQNETLLLYIGNQILLKVNSKVLGQILLLSVQFLIRFAERAKILIVMIGAGGFQLFILLVLFSLLNELLFLFIDFEIFNHHEVVQIAHNSNWIIEHVLILSWFLWLGITSSHILLFLLNSILLLDDYWLSQVVSVIYQFIIQEAVA